MAAKTYRELVAWQRAMDLVTEVYRVSRRFPRDETYGLTNQLRRAGVSVPSNIAEGQGRGMGLEFARFLKISQGSLQEMEKQLLIAERLGYVDAAALATIMAMADEVGRLLRGLSKSVGKCLTN